jgi:hypothetical protein
MTDEQVSANDKNEGKGTLELTPWMRERLEERAHPLFSQGISQNGGNRLTNVVKQHVGISDVLSRVGKLTFLSGAYHGILRKVGRTGTPELYRMIDLPWFRTRDASREEPMRERSWSGFEETGNVESKPLTKPEMPKKIISNVNATSKNNAQKGVFRDIASSERITTSYNSKSEIPAVKRMSSDAFFTTLISPPISREVIPSIGHGVGRPIVAKQAAKPGELDMPVSISTTGDERPSTVQRNRVHQDHTDDARRPPGHSSSGTLNNKGISEEPSETAGDNARLPRDAGQSKSSNADKSDSIPDAKSNENASQIVRLDLSLKSIQPLTERKDASQVYPPQELVHGKPLSISQRVIRALPFIKNIARKNDKVTLMAATRPDESGQKQESFSTTTINMVLPPAETSIPEFNTLTYRDKDLSGKADEQIQASNAHFNQITDESPEKPLAMAERKTRREVNQIYPPQDLVHKKQVSIGQKIMRAIPLVKKLVKKDENVALMPTTRQEKSTLTTTVISDKDTPQNDSFSMTKIEMVLPSGDAKVPESAAMTYEDKHLSEKAGDQTRTSNILGDEAIAEVPEQPIATAERINRKESTQIYPSKELILKEPRGISQQILRVLPLMRGTSKKGIAPHRVLPELQIPIESRENQPAGDNPEIPGMQEIISYFSQPAVELTHPAAQQSLSRAIDRNDISINRDSIMQNKNDSVPGIMGHAGHLDLFLSSASQLVRASDQVGSFQPSTQPLNLQRAQSSFPTQTVMQVETEQTQQGTGQTTAAQQGENSTNQNKNQLDLRALAREVYPFIRRMIIIERERRPSR